jgi:hypothetical protein
VIVDIYTYVIFLCILSIDSGQLYFTCITSNLIFLDVFVYSMKGRIIQGRSQCPRSLWNELSSAARTLGSWVRTPLKAWMSVFVLSCVQVAAFRRTDPPSKESYRLGKRSRNRKAAKAHQKDRRAIDKQIG